MTYSTRAEWSVFENEAAGAWLRAAEKRLWKRSSAYRWPLAREAAQTLGGAARSALTCSRIRSVDRKVIRSRSSSAMPTSDQSMWIATRVMAQPLSTGEGAPQDGYADAISETRVCHRVDALSFCDVSILG
jgi:hypothetical protein